MRNSEQAASVPQRAFTVAKAAKAYGRSRVHMHRLIKRGSIRAKKDGASTLIPADELERWFSSLPDAGPSDSNT